MISPCDNEDFVEKRHLYGKTGTSDYHKLHTLSHYNNWGVVTLDSFRMFVGV